MKKKTTIEFIEDARKVHGDKYDYSKVNYVNKRTKVCIICPIHGEFWQRPSDHLQGSGCYYCGRKKCIGKKVTTESFIREAKLIHGDKYDYSKVKYMGSKTKVCIICPEHGEFWQIPTAHISGQGCPNCKKYKLGKNKYDTNTFIEKAKLIHGDKYDYSKVSYDKSYSKVCIICPKHGEFWQEASRHLMGDGCPTCAKKYKLEKCAENFIERAKKAHGDKYDYSKTQYNGWLNKICIICPKHGEFWQIAGLHLGGRGCPKCKNSVLENKVEKLLKEKNISYIEKCKKELPWLGKQHLDFYLPDYNIAIECQGIQHFKELEYFDGKDGFIDTRKRDIKKYNLCKKHNVKLLYYTEDNNYNEFLGEKLFKSTDDLLVEIKKGELA